ncbi:hypothetical protein M9458_014727, partial [Cirrhinus mrigala]
WKGSAIQRPVCDLCLPPGLLRGHSHAVLFHQCVFLSGESGSRLWGPHLLPALPASCALLRLEGRPGLWRQDRY